MSNFNNKNGWISDFNIKILILKKLQNIIIFITSSVQNIIVLAA